MQIKIFLLLTSISILSASSMIKLTDKNTQLPTTPITVAEEFLQSSSLEVECDTLQKPRSIQYIPDINIIKNTVFEFTFTNCAIKNNGAQLYLVDKDGKKKAVLMLYETDNDGNYISASFYFNEEVINNSDKTLFLSTQYSTLTQPKTAKAPTIIVKEGLTQNNKVMIEVSKAYLMSGLEITHLKTEPKEIVDVVKGIKAKIEKPANSKIDIFNDRVKFIPNSTTTEQNSTASGIKLTTISEVGFTLDSSLELYEIIIENSYECLDVAKKEDSIILKPANPTPVEFSITGSCFWRWKGDFSDATGQALVSQGLNAIIQTTGDSIIKSKDWKTSINIRSMKPPLFGKHFKVLDKKTSHNWELNGEKFKVPYLNTQPKYGIYLIMTNNSDEDAEVYVDIYADRGVKTGKTQKAMACENVRLADLPANSTAMYNSSDIHDSINKTIGCLDFVETHHRYMGIFLVASKKDSIDMVAFQKNEEHGKRSVPVLTDRLNRTWGQ